MTIEIWKDLAALHKSCLPRIQMEYNRERKKLKIPNERTYQRCYPVRTKGKNNWLLFVEKAPAVSKYKSEVDIVFCAVLHYHGPKGWRVFKPLMQQEVIVVYNGHLFNRYNERLKLNLHHPVAIIQDFFKHNGYSDHQTIEKPERLFSLGVCRDGILIGEYRPSCKWLVNKTFVCRELYRTYQSKAENELIAALQAEIAEALLNDGRSTATLYEANTLEAITGLRKL